MNSHLVTRRRAEEFARLLDQQRRSHDPKVAHLLAVVSRLSPARIEPDADFRDSLREQLVATARAGEAVAPGSTPTIDRERRVRTSARWIAVAASVAVAGGMVGTAAAARHAMPGDALYGLKLGLERTEVAVSTNAESRGREYLKQADRRLREVTNLIGDGYVTSAETERIRLLDTALADFATLANDGGELLLTAYTERDSIAALTRLGAFSAEALRTLDGIEGAMPRELYAGHGHAVSVVRDLEDRVRSLCADCLTVASVEAAQAADGRSASASTDAGLAAGSGQAANEEFGSASEPNQQRADNGELVIADGHEGRERPDPDGEPGPESPSDPDTGPLPSRLPVPEPESTGGPPRGPDRGPLPQPDSTIGVPLPLPLPLPTIGNPTTPPSSPAPTPTGDATPVPNSIPLPKLPLPLPTAIPLPPILSGAHSGPAPEAPPVPREPTSTPTADTPAGVPTSTPKDAPTTPPAGTRTNTPDDSPTSTPTDSPTRSPTRSPAPTRAPNDTPTRPPSTSDPTPTPTVDPTIEPRDVPTNDWPTLLRLPLSLR